MISTFTPLTIKLILQSHILSSEFDLPYLELYRKDRYLEAVGLSKGGGVPIGISKKFDPVPFFVHPIADIVI